MIRAKEIKSIPGTPIKNLGANVKIKYTKNNIIIKI
jgi:hypothetical protein